MTTRPFALVIVHQCRPSKERLSTHQRASPQGDLLTTLTAVKSVADKMRSLTGLAEDGGGLVDKALGGDVPMIAINARSTVSEKSEQSGFANLVKGAFGMFRNPTAHEARIRWTMTKDDAEDLLTIVSLIHRRLDAAHQPPRP